MFSSGIRRIGRAVAVQIDGRLLPRSLWWFMAFSPYKTDQLPFPAGRTYPSSPTREAPARIVST